MALAAANLYKAETKQPPSGNLVYPASVRGKWITIHNDLEQASGITGVRPLSVTSTDIIPIQVPVGATRVLFRARYANGATVTTSPIIVVYGVWGELDGGAFTEGNDQVQCARLDNQDNSAAGITVTLDGTNDVDDATYQYSDIVPSLTGLDLLGASYVFAYPTTVANVNSGVVLLQALFIN